MNPGSRRDYEPLVDRGFCLTGNFFKPSYHVLTELPVDSETAAADRLESANRVVWFAPLRYRQAKDRRPLRFQKVPPAQTRGLDYGSIHVGRHQCCCELLF